MKASVARQPRLSPMGSPEWWHTHGWKMQFADGDLAVPLFLESSAATLTIARFGDRWLVRWWILHGTCQNSETYVRQSTEVEGRIVMSVSMLRAAFGLSDELSPADYPDESNWLLERYGGTVALQGHFIRYERFLNIPGPGTGHDGDSNISIEVTPEIRAAIEQLLIH